MLKAQNIYIRLLKLEDTNEFLQLEMKNREFFQTFTMKRSPDYYTIDFQKDLMNQKIERAKVDSEYNFGIFKIENDELIGTIGLFRILRGPLQSAIVGYSLDKNNNGKGYATEAVKLIVNYAFTTLKLHRIEAGVMPHNISSIRVLEKAGFEKEGISKKNVKINGRWEDHQTLAIINPEE
ncbi:GNAT family N-acetyltransferase [Metabacillus niabensis]|uniref:Ribosomal-protein-alanine N-acetyltransferase n=1 Tax=Metabacillus niabensis TaxID=324854 RepID=A0ABT9Z5M8_9BACI|nr:GNAT family protein [Metabacillus niabensis]MDQ0227269.1 ribosomal-protein-alanine N-acetyltransferase [Metabacillus niabensis]